MVATRYSPLDTHYSLLDGPGAHPFGFGARLLEVLAFEAGLLVAFVVRLELDGPADPQRVAGALLPAPRAGQYRVTVLISKRAPVDCAACEAWEGLKRDRVSRGKSDLFVDVQGGAPA